MQKKEKKELMGTCASATKFNSVRKGITIAVEMTLCVTCYTLLPLVRTVRITKYGLP